MMFYFFSQENKKRKYILSSTNIMNLKIMTHWKKYLKIHLPQETMSCITQILIFLSKSNDTIVKESELFYWDDEHVATESTCHPMSLNIDSDFASGKLALESSEGGISTRCQINRVVAINHLDYFKEHLEWKRNKAKAKKKKKDKNKSKNKHKWQKKLILMSTLR